MKNYKLKDNKFNALAAILRQAIEKPGEFAHLIGPDCTDKLREAGIPIDAGTVVGISLGTTSQHHGNLNINVKNAGYDWHGSLTLNLEKGNKGA